MACCWNRPRQSPRVVNKKNPAKRRVSICGNSENLARRGAAMNLGSVYSIEMNALNLRNSSDSFTSLTRMRGWTGANFGFEIDQRSDFRAIAIASYRPEIRYWLGGDNWANFGAPSPGQQVWSGSGNQNHFRESGVNYTADSQYSSNNIGDPQSKSKISTPITINEFIISLFNKIIRQPVFYIILLVGVGLFFWSTSRQPAS